MIDPVPESSPASKPRASVRRNSRISPVWLVPVVAALLAGWLVWQQYQSKGVQAALRFQTADGLEAGNTEVRCRSVKIGMVESVELSQDLQSVEVAIRVDADSSHLLRKGARFWVVRPRVSAAELSGLSTLLNGAYIELDPGEGGEPELQFIGLEQPPATGSSVPGLRLTLVAERTGSLNTGSPIYCEGYEVGQVERRTFDVRDRTTRFEIFIREEFAGLVTEGTAFWNTGGIDFSAGAGGFRLHTPSFQALLAGGASFGVPPGREAGPPARDGRTFPLFANEDATREAVFEPDRRCLLLFDQSVRGLQKDAPVEFRGLPLGKVVDISLIYAPADEKRIPVLIEVDSSILQSTPGIEGESATEILSRAVQNGLRARLATGSLLTGSLFVDLDYQPQAPPAELIHRPNYDILPTLSSGLAQLEEKVNSILTKIDALPLDAVLRQFGTTAGELSVTSQEATATLAEARKLLASNDTQGLTRELDQTLREARSSLASLGPAGAVQGDLRRTLDELRAALRAFTSLSKTIDDKPNSLLFGRESSGDPVPKARRKSK